MGKKKTGKKRNDYQAGRLGARSRIMADKPIDRQLIYLLSGVLPFVCMIIIYALFKVYPFGERTALVMDLNGQYADFFMYYHRVLSGQDSLFYSFTKEMGGNVFGLFAYYLSSPFFLLALISPPSVMPEMIALITALKIGACGLTFSIFLIHVYKKDNICVVLFSCAYALMTYSMHYSMCIMWLDGVIWLPLVLLGIERILDGKSPLLLLISYTAALISNYYTAYMTTIFAGLFFFYRWTAREDKKSVKDIIIKLLKVIGTGALGILLSAWVLFPTLMDIMQGKLATSAYVADGFLNKGIESIWRRLFIGQYDSITNSGTPNIFCGVLCALMIALFFLNPKIKLRVKLAALCMYAVLIVSFFIKKADMAWHLFQYPNWYPYRYAYVFNFFSVMLAFAGFINIDKAQLKYMLAGAAVYAVVLIFVWYAKHDVLTNIKLARLTMVLAAFYAAAVVLYHSQPEYRQRACAVLIAVTCAELIANGFYTLKGLDGEHKFKLRGEYTDKVATISDAVRYIKTADDGFYRAEKTISRTDNDSMSFGYNGMTHYSSTYNNNVRSFNRNMGMLQESVLIRYMGSTIITDSLLGVKYIVSDSDVNDDYELIYENDGCRIYKNPYALPIAFAAPVSSLETPSYSGSFMRNQDAFMSSVLRQSVVTRVGTADFTASEDAMYYFESSRKYGGNIKLTVNGESVPYKYDKHEKKLFYLGRFSKGDRVQVTLDNTDAQRRITVYAVNDDAVRQNIENKINNCGFTVTDHGRRWIEGESELKHDQLLFTTIPYEKGWRVYVDGERKEVEKAQGVFLAVRAGEGRHTVRFEYRTPGFAGALIVSLLTLAAILVYIYRKQIAAAIRRKK